VNEESASTGIVMIANDVNARLYIKMAKNQKEEGENGKQKK